MSFVLGHLRSSLRGLSLALVSTATMTAGCGTVLGLEDTEYTAPKGGDTDAGADSAADTGTDTSQDGATKDSGGQDVATDTSGQDVATDTSGQDVATDTGGQDVATDTSVNDAKTDTSTCTEGLPCSTAQGAGLCVEGTCGPCRDPQDDGTCRQVYGSDSYVCAAGVCVLHGCHDNGNCAGKLCSPTTHVCEPCKTITDCAGPGGYGKDTICRLSTGTCVSNTCSSTGKACSADPSLLCCGGHCVDGDCCSNTDCSTGSGSQAAQVCLGNQCTSCDAVTGHVYYVDPLHGRDGDGTPGSKTAGGKPAPACSFKTIHAAFAAIGKASPGTEVQVVGPANVSLKTGETFPIAVPENVTLTGTGTVRIIVPSTKDGVSLAFPNSGISGLTLDGQGLAENGIDVTDNASEQTTKIAHTKVTRMKRDGLVTHSGGGVLIGGDTTFDANGDTGLRVYHGRVRVVAPSSTSKVSVINSGSAGIRILSGGTLSLEGSPTTPSIIVSDNQGAGMFINQDGNIPGTNMITDALFTKNGGDGINIKVKSSLTLRHCRIVGNSDNGVKITNGSLHCSSSYVDKIDLGTKDDYGYNVLQDAATPNKGVGLCANLIDLYHNCIISALGNIFTNEDCSGSPSSALSFSKGCDGGKDVGQVSSGTVKAFDVEKCTY